MHQCKTEDAQQKSACIWLSLAEKRKTQLQEGEEEEEQLAAPVLCLSQRRLFLSLKASRHRATSARGRDSSSARRYGFLSEEELNALSVSKSEG